MSVAVEMMPEQHLGPLPPDADSREAASPYPDFQAQSAGSAPRKFLRRGAGRGVNGTQAKAPETRGPLRTAGDATGLLAFLKGGGPDLSGRMLQDMWQWDFERMEAVHDYVQWMFPTDEMSRHNLNAPRLTPKLQRTILGDAVMQASVRKSLVKFLDFLGLEMVDEEVVGEESVLSIRKASHFRERVPVCWQAGCSGRGGNHNWLRVSRVLHCLKLVGMNAEAEAFMLCLEGLFASGVRCSAAITHWRKRAATEPVYDGKVSASD